MHHKECEKQIENVFLKSCKYTVNHSVPLHLFQYVTLRTRYSELMTLTSQYIKFIIETQRRLEDDEVITLKLWRHAAAAGFCHKPSLTQTMPPFTL